jgi:adenosylhomocysteinase
MAEAAKYGDIFVTVTGCKDVITKEHMQVMKDGAVLSNAGHFDVEVNKHHLEELSVIPPYEVRKNIMTYTMADGRKLNLLGEGRLVNLACGDGHPIEVMDLSFAMQFLAMKYLLEHKGSMENKLYVLPEELNTEVAALKLEAMGAGIDKLTPEQQAYLEQE